MNSSQSGRFEKRFMKTKWEGRFGFELRVRPDFANDKSAFLVLHRWQQATVFSQVFSPPFD